MGLQTIQKLEIEYNPNQIEEKKEIFDRLDNLKRKGILEDWQLTETEERNTNTAEQD